jgi:uncharacterized protein YqjF (DUF2071 family)
MRIPRLRGIIRRRLLINYRAEPEIVQHLIPAPFRPKLHDGLAFVGICLIRLEYIRPAFLPRAMRLSSENAAHRVAVVWTDHSGIEREGVYILRRDSNSRLNQLVGGRLFPGRHHPARRQVHDDGAAIDLTLKTQDGAADVHVTGRNGDLLPLTSCFASLNAASAFFQGGSVGFSPTNDAMQSDGMTLRIRNWAVRPLSISRAWSRFFEGSRHFPAGSIDFDHALIMRDIVHEWLTTDPMRHVAFAPSP